MKTIISIAFVGAMLAMAGCASSQAPKEPSAATDRSRKGSTRDTKPPGNKSFEVAYTHTKDKNNKKGHSLAMDVNEVDDSNVGDYKFVWHSTTNFSLVMPPMASLTWALGSYGLENNRPWIFPTKFYRVFDATMRGTNDWVVNLEASNYPSKTNYHYHITVPSLKSVQTRTLPFQYYYDMVDATLDWGDPSPK
jgi:hypothetical protein